MDNIQRICTSIYDREFVAEFPLKQQVYIWTIHSQTEHEVRFQTSFLHKFMKMDVTIIGCASPNIKGLTICWGNLFVFWTEIIIITTILFLYLISHNFAKRKCEKLVFKIDLHQFVDVWRYPKLSDVFNFFSTVNIMLHNRGVRKHSLHKLLSQL